MFNVISLIAGFFFGQGSIFLAQTFLLMAGNQERVTEFGIGYSFLILIMLVVESGSVQYLTRGTVLSKGNSDQISIMYSQTIIYRLLISILAVLFILLYSRFAADEFLKTFLLFSIPIFIFHSFSAAGVLDGMRKSGLNGVVMAIQNITLSVSLFFTSSLDSYLAAKYIALSLVSIYFFLVVYFIFYVRIKGVVISFRKIGLRDIFSVAKSGLPLLFSLLPGQLFQRLQLLLSRAFFGVEITAYLIYAKQIISSVSQLIAFVRRVEFPNLVKCVEDTYGFELLYSGLKKQWYSFILSLFAFVALPILPFLATYFSLSYFDQIGDLLVVASVLILSESLSSSVMYILTAKGGFYIVAAIRMMIIMVVSLFLYFFIESFKVEHMIFLECFSQISISIVGAVVIIFKRRRYFA